MKNVQALALAALAAAPFAVPAYAAAAAPSDQAQIQRIYQQFTEAVRHRDVNAIMSFYVHDNSLFVYDVAPPRQYVGWDAYRADWKGILGAMNGPPQFTVRNLGVTVSGDAAYAHSDQDVRATFGKTPMHLLVRVTDVLRKIDGRWLIVQEHVSVPVDLKTGKAVWISH